MTEHSTARDRLERRGPLSITWPALAEFGAYAVAVALVCWPALLHARTQMIGGGGDSRYYTWLGWRLGRLIGEGHLLPGRIPDVIAPFGLDVRLLDGYLPTYVIGLWNLVVGPFLAFNLTIVVGAALNVLGARSLARRLSTRRLVWVFSAIAFLTAAPIALSVQLGWLALFWAFTAPLFVGEAIDVARGTNGVRLLRLTALLIVAFLCSVYLLVFGGLAYGVIVGVAAVRRRSWKIPLRTAAAVLLSLLVLLPFVVPRIRLDRSEKPLLSDSYLYSADALSIVAQPTRSSFLLPRPTVIDQSIIRLPDTRHALESTLFPGLLLLVGFATFLIRRHPLRVPLGLAAATLLVAAFGPSLKFGGDFVWKHAGKPIGWLPYGLLLDLPGFGALRVPVRSAEVLVAVMVAGAAVVLDRLFERATAAVVAVGCGLLLATNLLIPVPTVSMHTSPAVYDAFGSVKLRKHPGDTLISVPFDCDPYFASYQLLHEAPVVGCANQLAANPWQSKMTAYTSSEALTKLRCNKKKYGRIATPVHPEEPFGPADVAQLQRQFGVRFVVINRELASYCPTVATAVQFLHQYQRLGIDRTIEVFDLSALEHGA